MTFIIPLFRLCNCHVIISGTMCKQMASVLWVAVFYILLQQARSQGCGGSGADSADCKCLWSTNTLDISSLFTYPHQVVSSDGKYEYDYSPCQPQSCGTTAESNVCQRNVASPSSNPINCGINPSWTITNSTYFVIQYTATCIGCVKRITTVTFVQDGTSPSRATAVVESATTKGQYAFTVYFRAGGGGGGGNSGGNASGFVGFILMILMLAALVAYFVAGAIIMYTVKGARGIEIIPNIGFWKDLPFLIKDGVMFMLSPCLGQTRGYTKM